MTLPQLPSGPTVLVAAIALALAAAGVLVPVLAVLLLIFAGILFGVFLNGLTRWIARVVRLSYRATYGLTVTVLLVVGVSGLFFMGASIAVQFSELSTQLQTAVENAAERLNGFDGARLLIPSGGQVQESLSKDALPTVLFGVQSALGAVAGLFIVIVIGLYLAFDPALYVGGLIKLFPPEERERVRNVLVSIASALGSWIAARLISMSVIGVLTALGLWLLGVPLAVTLGFLAALLTFIPNLGPILAAIPQALLAFQVGGNIVLYVLLFNLVLQSLEGYFLTPIIERYQVTLPPALTLSVQAILGVLVGIVGLMVAAPLTATGMVLVQSLYLRDQLHETHPGTLVDGGANTD